MASSKHDPKIPKRFLPLLAQVQTEGALRYGGQESGLQSIFDQATQYTQQAGSQRDAGMSLLGSLGRADTDLQKVYTDAGLTPSLLSQIAGSPTGQRLAGELASGRAGIQDQTLGAQAGQQYIQGHLADNYRQDVGDINRQAQQLATEKGLFQSATLDQLIAGDRSMRHDANLAASKLQYDSDQSALDRTNSSNNALISQGLLPDANGNLTPLPGGKADPNAPANQPKPGKRTTGPGTASPDAQRTAGNSFTQAVAIAQGLIKGKPHTPDNRTGVTNILTNGKPASGGGTVYTEEPVLGPDGRPKVDADGKPVTKQVRKLNPDGSPVTTSKRPAVPAFDRAIAEAATEQAMYGYVTTATVRKLQTLGYSVRQFPGLTTENQNRASRPRPTNTAPPPGRPVAGT